MIVIDFVVRALAIVGSFAIGAVFTHWRWHRIAHKWYKDQKLPPWVEWLSRALGGTIFAIIAYWATFGGGGPGMGGTGGWFGGSQPYRAPDGGKDVTKDKDKEKEKDKLKDDKKEPPQREFQLRDSTKFVFFAATGKKEAVGKEAYKVEQFKEGARVVVIADGGGRATEVRVGTPAQEPKK